MGTVEFNDQLITYSDEFSFKNYTNANFVDIPNGTIVYASMFYNEQMDKELFRSNMRNVKFYACNLDNIVIPPTCQVIGGKNRRIKVMNDLRDWIVDAQDRPIKLNLEKLWTLKGYSVDPKDIPAQKLQGKSTPEEVMEHIKNEKLKAGGK